MVEQLDLAARYVDAEMHAGNLARARPGSTLRRRRGRACPGRRAGVAAALDLDADAGGIGVGVEFLDLDPHLGAAPVAYAQLGRKEEARDALPKYTDFLIYWEPRIDTHMEW